MGIRNEEGKLTSCYLHKRDLFLRKVAWPNRLNRDHSLELVGAELEALGTEEYDWDGQHGAEELLAKLRFNVEA